MLIEQLEEFCMLSLMLNYTKAANELHISQSSLSRHIKSMEDELGFQLVANKHNQIFITREGNMFLNGVLPMVESYRDLVQKCRSYRDSSVCELYIQEPPYLDIAGLAFLRLFSRFKAENPGVFAHYVDPPQLEDILEGDSIDIALEYRYGDLEALLAEYEEVGTPAALICDTPFFLCCNGDSPLAERETISFMEMADYRVMMMFDSYVPTRKAIEEIYSDHGVKPKWHNYTVKSMTEFLMAPKPADGIYLFPEGVEHTVRMMGQEGAVFIPIEDVKLHFFAVFRPTYADTPLLAKLFDLIADNGGE